MPFFRIRNVLNYCKSIFYSKIDCGKDTLYRFKKDNSINFRKINFHIAKKLRNCIDDGTDNNSKLPECLIIDDTDLKKTGYCFELLGFQSQICACRQLVLQHRTDKVRHKNIENKLPRHGKAREHKVLL